MTIYQYRSARRENVGICRRARLVRPHGLAHERARIALAWLRLAYHGKGVA